MERGGSSFRANMSGESGIPTRQRIDRILGARHANDILVECSSGTVCVPDFLSQSCKVKRPGGLAQPARGEPKQRQMRFLPIISEHDHVRWSANSLSKSH